jgi:hypothetical protein
MFSIGYDQSTSVTAEVNNHTDDTCSWSSIANARQLKLFDVEVRSILEGLRPQRVHVLYFDCDDPQG